jgi:putative transposase
MDATGKGSSRSAHRRFQEWTQSGVFQLLWAQGLLDYDELKGIEWEWQAIDGVMTKAPLGQEQTGPNPTDRAKCGVKRSLLIRWDKKIENYLGLLHLACACITYRATSLLG